MNKIALSLIAAAVLSLPVRASAGSFEAQTGVELGGGYFGATPGRLGLLITERLRFVPEIPFALEVNVYAPYGAGAGVVVDVYRGRNLRVHLFDLGVFVPFIQDLHVSRPDIRRDWDITLGAGLEYYEEKSGLTVMFDWRAYLPDPTTIPTHYGGFAIPIYKDALQGSQLWLGIGKRF